MKAKKMDNERESIMSIMAAMLVLFTAMLDPKISVGLALALLISFTGYKYYQSKKLK